MVNDNRLWLIMHPKQIYLAKRTRMPFACQLQLIPTQRKSPRGDCVPAMVLNVAVGIRMERTWCDIYPKTSRTEHRSAVSVCHVMTSFPRGDRPITNQLATGSFPNDSWDKCGCTYTAEVLQFDMPMKEGKGSQL